MRPTYLYLYIDKFYSDQLPQVYNLYIFTHIYSRDILYTFTLRFYMFTITSNIFTTIIIYLYNEVLYNDYNALTQRILLQHEYILIQRILIQR